MIPSFFTSRLRDNLIEYMDLPFDRCDREKDYDTAWAYFSNQQEVKSL